MLQSVTTAEDPQYSVIPSPKISQGQEHRNSEEVITHLQFNPSVSHPAACRSQTALTFPPVKQEHLLLERVLSSLTLKLLTHLITILFLFSHFHCSGRLFFTQEYHRLILGVLFGLLLGESKTKRGSKQVVCTQNC